MFDNERKTLRDIDGEISEIIRANEKSLEEWKGAIVNAKKEAALIGAKLSDNANDPGKIANLAEEKAQADAKLKALFSYRDNTTGRPLISDYDYRAMVDRIKSAALEAANKALLTILDNYNANISIADELADIQNEANRVLKRLQHDIYKDTDMITRTTDGKIFRANMYRKTVNIWPVINFADIRREADVMYNEMTEKAEAYRAKTQPED